MTAPAPLRIATLTISDTRRSDDDESGRLLGSLLVSAGFQIVSHEIVQDDPELIRERVTLLADLGSADAVVTSGGTGIGPRDRTVEALEPLLDLRLEGFGEAFRRLSFDEIGPRAILSRSVAGTRGRCFVCALPGSPKAVRLGVEALLAPLLGHAVALLQGRTQH